MKSFFINNKLTLVGLVLGSIVGFLYWKFIGCNSGSCAITSKPINSSVYGAVFGALLFSTFKKSK